MLENSINTEADESLVHQWFTLALCGFTFSVLCYFLSSELRGDKDDRPKELTIVDDKGKEYSVGEYLTKDEIVKKGEQEIENTKIIAQAQAEAIKQGKYAPVPNTVVVQDLKALGSVRDLMQPNEQ